MSLMLCEEYTVNGLWRVIFRLSRVKIAAAARFFRHEGHPKTVLSSCLERYATAWRVGPLCCPKSPTAVPCLSVIYKQKGLDMSGRRRAGARRRASWRILKGEDIGVEGFRGS